jgi:hypothetical protein
MIDQRSIILTQPLLEAITLRLADSAPAPVGRYARRCLIAVLGSWLQRSSAGWRVRRVPRSPLLEVDLLPPAHDSISPDQAWELSYLLAEQPHVLSAEPSFGVVQSIDAPEPDIEPAQEIAAAAVASPTFESCLDDAAPLSVDPNDKDWSPRLIDAHCAWRVVPPGQHDGFPAGKSRGAGIRIGHPDSGYRIHPEMFSEEPGQPSRVLTRLERDFIDDDRIAEDPRGDHGLSTASVLMSSETQGQIVGVAPASTLVPLRVTKPRLGIIPAPVLFADGAGALRDAIRYAISSTVKCHVISISLGWLPNGSLHNAIRDAVRQNVIVCAAAGNYVGFVVWPAAYPEVIAVAGCNAARRPWSGSSAGRKVGISAPAEQVWRARFTSGGAPISQPSDGTSYAVASLAGVAALWLAHHGRAFLLDRYHPAFTLTDVFRWVLGRSSDPFAVDVGDGYGVGIVNARRVLTTPLPSHADLHAALPAAQPVVFAAPATPRATEQIITAFDTLPAEQVRTRLASELEIPPDELDSRLDGVSDEMLFHLLTQPDLRNELIRPVAPSPAAMDTGTAATTPGAMRNTLLASNQLSARLRDRLSAP